jgi:hypothetical protein
MKMRERLSMAAAAAVLVLSTVAGGCDRKEPAPPPEPVKVESAQAGKKTASAARVKWLTGTIVALDPGEGTLTVKGPKGSMRLDAQEKAQKELMELKIGDKVIVKHAGTEALSVVKPRPGRKPLPAEGKVRPAPRAQ